MSRKTTIAPHWIPLVNAVGGLTKLYNLLGMSQSTFRRATLGQSEFRPEQLQQLKRICRQKDVSNPLDSEPPRFRRDLSELRALGTELLMADRKEIAPPAASQVAKVKELYPVEQLRQLAESDELANAANAAPIIRAVMSLLED